MKAGWETKPLADVCQIKPPKAEARQRISGKELVSFVPMEALGIDQKFLVPTQTKPLEDVAGSYTYFADGDVLLAKITPCFENGKLGIADALTNGIGFGSSEYIVFRPSPAVDKEWLYYFLSRQSFREEGAAQMSGAVGHKRVSKEFIESYPIPVPPLPEQHRIVALLDEAFNGIATARANAEKNLHNARALFESHLQKVFTQRGEEWIEKRLGDVFTTATGTTPPKSNADFYGDFIPLVKPPELCNELIDSASDGLSEDGAAVARLLPQKSILVSCIGNLGKVGLNTVPVAFNQQINAILPDESHAIPEFMFFQTLAPVFKEQLESLASGTTVPIVNKSKFNSVGVVLPPLPIQRSVAAQFSLLREETQRLESLYQRKLAALDALKQSLLHQAFSGAL